MLTNKPSLTVGLLLVTPLFGMQPLGNVLNRARGNSFAVESTLKKFVDSPIESTSRSPELLTPQELGAFDDEFGDQREVSDNDNDQNVIFMCIPEKKAEKETNNQKKTKTSKADLSSNWRNDPRSKAGFESFFSQAQRPTSPYKKSSSRPTNISTNCRASTQPLVTDPQQKSRDHDHNKTTTRASQELTPKAGYAVWAAPQLAVVAKAATLYDRTNIFDRLSEEEV